MTVDDLLGEARALQRRGIAPERTALLLLRVWSIDNPGAPAPPHVVEPRRITLLFSDGRLVWDGQAWRAAALLVA